MSAVKQAVNVLDKIPSTRDTLATGEFTQEDGVPNERTTVAKTQFDRATAVQEGQYDLDLVAYESFSTNGTAGDTETFALGHDLIDADSVAEDFILYEAGTRATADSVDYAANSFTYTDDGTNNTLHVFYVASDQAHVEVRKVAPNGTYEVLDEADVGLINQRNQNKDPLEFEFDHQLQGVLPANWTLEVVVDAPYTVSWGVDTDGDGTDEAEPLNQMIHAPIRRTRQSAPDFIGDVVASVAAQR